jgi:6-phosphogluconolactonase
MSIKITNYILALLAIVIGCAQISPVIAETLYVSHDKTNTVSGYLIESSTGMLTKLEMGEVATGYGPERIVTVLGKYLYTGDVAGNTISFHAISKDTKYLTPLSPYKINTLSSPWGVNFDPSTQYLYVGNYTSSNISQYKFNQSTGALTPLSPSTIKAGTGTTSIAFDPLRTPYAYVASFNQNDIWIYRFESETGQLTDTKIRVATGAQPRGVVFDNAHHAYVLNYNSSTISMYYANPNDGMLEPFVKTGVYPISLRIDNSGHYAYVAAYAENKIYMYKINSTGIFEPLSPPTIVTGYGPRSITTDHNNHLYVTNISENTISMYNVESGTGQLHPFNPAKIKVDNSPYGLAMDIH